MDPVSVVCDERRIGKVTVDLVSVVRDARHVGKTIPDGFSKTKVSGRRWAPEDRET